MSELAAGAVPESVVVVGASAAGLTTSEALRREGFTGSITLIGEESSLPYDRPPLSKQVLAGLWPEERAQLRERDHLRQLDIELVTGEAAVALDVQARSVTTASGREHRGEAIVLATGLRARGLAGHDSATGVHAIRTVEDARRLRTALRPGARVLVVGGGVLGCEIAATTRTLGHEVTVVAPQQVLMEGQLGPVVGGLLTELHREQGVKLRLGQRVQELLLREGTARGARLVGGEELEADVVVLALGGVPATEWLAGSGLELTDGIVCDSRCRAAPGIYAAGDVARFEHLDLGRSLRLENRTNATEQAMAVAGAIMGAERPYVPVPHFWTDQFAAKIQVHGLIGPDSEVTVAEGDPSLRRFVGHALEGGHGVGVIGWNMPKQTRQHRRRLLERVGASL